MYQCYDIQITNARAPTCSKGAERDFLPEFKVPRAVPSKAREARSGLLSTSWSCAYRHLSIDHVAIPRISSLILEQPPAPVGEQFRDSRAQKQ